MFGYIIVNKPELKIREFEEYRSYYCGLCRELKKKYGLFGRLTLNYDITFLSMILSSLYEPETLCCDRRCFVHGCIRQKERTSEISSYAADMNILLTYYKCIDDWNDERKLTRLLFSRILYRKLKKHNILNEKSEKIGRLFEENLDNEKKRGLSAEEYSVIFGKIMAEIFSMKDDIWKEDISKCGFYLGKFVYLLDAYDDMTKDIPKGRFNPFADIKDEADFENQVKSLLTMTASSCSYYFERLPLVDDIEIMRNILYAGIWVKYDNIKEKRLNGSV